MAIASSGLLCSADAALFRARLRTLEPPYRRATPYTLVGAGTSLAILNPQGGAACGRAGKPSLARPLSRSTINRDRRLALGHEQVRPLWQALVDGLREHGWEEGRNLILERRFTGQDPARYPELAAELVALKVDAIIAGDSQAVEAARRQTATIPIIMLFSADPVRSGFVASLAQPGGNITGLSGQYESLVGKTLELLKEVSPTINRVGIIFSPDNVASAANAKEQQEKMAPGLGLIGLPIPISGSADFACAAIGYPGGRFPKQRTAASFRAHD
jgi:hypothetical protein